MRKKWSAFSGFIQKNVPELILLMGLLLIDYAAFRVNYTLGFFIAGVTQVALALFVILNPVRRRQ